MDSNNQSNMFDQGHRYPLPPSWSHRIRYIILNRYTTILTFLYLMIKSKYILIEINGQKGNLLQDAQSLKLSIY